MDYEDLVKSLREPCPHENCVLCQNAADAIEELQAQIDGWIEQERKALLKSVPKWVSVTEQLPKYGTPVLAYGSRGGIFVAKYERARAEWDIDYWWKLNSAIHVCNPTHWMPLPEPPKEEA